ncbi:protein-disulfide isomerase [Microbacterium halimionae]|uniref:Protein-disulfide isomerase n=1 Tax=Microbacterium halimionae TaxID=1526413 RepID=A0A7W3JMM2_9MICO|nr:thioredoxin domain-containing protein [Microbacterium halimionae]MBA8815635.1 protein-disulfide isomerase [Microbacterium halimionae]NII95682.1 protein-disulfide isomerase [Microbacterium halimionae]
MSSDDPSNVPEARDRRDAVREKAAQVHAKQSRARKIRFSILAVSAVVVVALVAGGVTWAVVSNASQPQLQPQNTNDGFVITEVSGVAGAAQSVPDPGETEQADDEPTPKVSTAVDEVEIRVYIDYLSTGARDFELANAQQLSTWVSNDVATLTYYPVAMLTAKSNGTKYSLRAASAVACVATYSPEAVFAFNHNVLDKQPAEATDGLSDSDLADIAQASGVTSPKLVRSCIEDEKFVSWARGATDRALEGIPDTDSETLTGTPTILVNGEPYLGSLTDPKEFSQFVLTVASDSYYTTPSPTPSPTSGSATPTPTP